ncbi:Uncharacterised protein [Chromobacterium vaccinii]|nr:Uncharacterised protein [Chromobacterium vaccinii]
MDALLHERGAISLYLKLARACEDGKMDGVPQLCDQLGLSSEQLNQAHISALAWVEELGL